MFSNNTREVNVSSFDEFKFSFFFQGTDLPNPVYCPRKCGRCYRGAKRKGNLNSHLKYECGVPKKFLCTVCSKRFALKSSLKNHYGLVHSLILP